MQQQVSELIEHLSHTHVQLVRVLDAERHVAVRMGEIVHALPDFNPEFEGVAALIDNAQLMTKSLVGYLNSLAELEETIAEHLSHIMKELDGADEE